jgi:outer membrane protein OmpA-like peptidoglycan-associated protein
VSLQNVQFLPDSAILQTSEKKKLDAIAEILKRYPDRDLLITGHTALAGTETGRQKLSEARAAAVGNYLLQNRVRQEDQIVIRGMGAREPIADNRSEEGMRQNRRVEITILEN